MTHKEVMIEIFGIIGENNETNRRKYYNLMNSAIHALEKISDKPFLEVKRYELKEEPQNIKILSVNNAH